MEAKERYISDRDNRAAGFKSVYDYKKGTLVRVLDAADGGYIPAIVDGQYLDSDGSYGLVVHRVDETSYNSFQAPFWTVKQ